MLEVLAWVFGVLLFLVILAVSIGLHEAGHMIVAKKFKLSVPKFFIGFGPTLWKKSTKDTEYGIKLIPLGGFVMIEDRSQKADSDELGLLSFVAPWKRMLVYAAGPAVNIVLGIAVLFGTLMAFPSVAATQEVASINNCEQAEESCASFNSGLLVGDVIKSIDGTALNSSEEFASLLAGKDTVLIEVDRGGSILELPITLQNNMMGIKLNTEEYMLSPTQAFDSIGNIFSLNFEAISKIPSKMEPLLLTILGAEKDPESPSSVIAVGKTYGDVSASKIIPSEDKVQMMFMYGGLLNVGLGLINLIPIMPLDGGRMLIAFFDSVRLRWSKIRKIDYSPVSSKTVGIMAGVTGLMVFSFMFLVMLSDVVLITRGEL